MTKHCFTKVCGGGSTSGDALIRNQTPAGLCLPSIGNAKSGRARFHARGRYVRYNK